MIQYPKFTGELYRSFFEQGEAEAPAPAGTPPDNNNNPSDNPLPQDNSAAKDIQKYFPYTFNDFRLNPSMMDALNKVLTELQRSAGDVKNVKQSLRFNKNKSGNEYDIIFPGIKFNQNAAEKVVAKLRAVTNLLTMRVMSSKTFIKNSAYRRSDEDEENETGVIKDKKKSDLVLQDITDKGIDLQINQAYKEFLQGVRGGKRRGSDQAETFKVAVNNNILKKQSREPGDNRIQLTKSQIEKLFKVFRAAANDTNVRTSDPFWWQDEERSIVNRSGVAGSESIKEKEYLVLEISTKKTLYNTDIAKIDMKRLNREQFDALASYIEETFPKESAKVLRNDDPIEQQGVDIFNLIDNAGKVRVFRLYPMTGTGVGWLGRKNIVDQLSIKRKLQTKEIYQLMKNAVSKWISSDNNGVIGYVVTKGKYNQGVSYGNKKPHEILSDLEEITGQSIKFDPNQLQMKEIGATQ